MYYYMHEYINKLNIIKLIFTKEKRTINSIYSSTYNE